MSDLELWMFTWIEDRAGSYSTTDALGKEELIVFGRDGSHH